MTQKPKKSRLKRTLVSASYDDILSFIDSIKPKEYARTRNYINGSVSKLSPYISRGVISTKFIFDKLQARGNSWNEIEKFVQELCWRDFWQIQWSSFGEIINRDVRFSQKNTISGLLPENIVDVNTGITAIDEAIKNLYSSGYMHNHARLYTASLVCNVGQTEWKTPAKWLYYHLLDGDWGSNALSWQWVAGTSSKKKYFANQENINKFCHSDEKTYLSIPYVDLENIPLPSELKQRKDLAFNTVLPKSNINLNLSLPFYIYNYYNLDPYWCKEPANKILLLEPSVFDEYPVSSKCIDLALNLSKNIPGIQLFVGEFDELERLVVNSSIHFKEHPLNKYRGIQHERDWLAPKADYSFSFFKYWSSVKHHLNIEKEL